MKPIIRWTIGHSSSLALSVLNRSVNNIRKIYEDKFHLVLCFNNIEKSFVEKICVDEFLLQSDFIDSIIPNGPAWKLCPARTCDNVHEIMLDNDVVIYKKLDCIERFLGSENMFLATEAFSRNYSSRFNNCIKQGFNINSGFIGLPPKYDYKMEIKQACLGIKEWAGHFDEQSVVAYVLQNKSVEIIPQEHISVSGSMTTYQIGEFGTHFVGINCGYDKHWKMFNVSFI